jgi:hypothetical protein
VQKWNLWPAVTNAPHRDTYTEVRPEIQVPGRHPYKSDQSTAQGSILRAKPWLRRGPLVQSPGTDMIPHSHPTFHDTLPLVVQTTPVPVQICHKSRAPCRFPRLQQDN